MTTMQDCSVGLGVESTYGTGVTPTRWLEFVDESLDFNKEIKQGQGLRVGTRVARSARRVIPTADAGGDVTVEVLSKGLGLFLQAIFGTGASTLVSGTTYQQVFTLGDTPSSLTIQKGLPRVDGTVDAYTYTGCMVESAEFSFDNADIVKVKATFDAKDVTTATGYAAPTYASGANLLNFAGGSIFSGTLTAPTTTALASGSTPIAGIRGGSLTIGNAPATDRYNLGGAGRKDKPTVGLRDIGGSLSAEYASATFRDAILNDSPMALVLQWTGGALSTGLETLQLVVPEVKFDAAIAKANGGNLIMQDLKFVGLDNLTAAQPVWAVVRTSDNAL